MGAARRLDLLHGVAPLGPRLIHLAGGGVFNGVLLLVLASRGKLDHLSGAGNHGRVQVDGAAAREKELVKTDAQLMRRGEVGVEGTEDARAAGNRSDGDDVTGRLRACGDAEMVGHVRRVTRPGRGSADQPCARALRCRGRSRAEFRREQ